MSGYTMLGCGLWDWPRWPPLSYEARNLWLAIYTSPETKRLVPGLFHGGLSSLAEASKMGYQDAASALGQLEERQLAEVDPVSRVIRLTELPDKHERAPNGRALRGFWNRFKCVPQCPTRDRHVQLLGWLQDPMTEDHRKAWSETFATVSTPLHRNGIANGMPNGSAYGFTSSPSEAPPQPLLFASADIGNRIPNGMPNPRVPDQVQVQEKGESEREGAGGSEIHGVPVAPGLSAELAAALGKGLANYTPAEADHPDLRRRR